MSAQLKDPINRIEWRNVEDLKPNGWNPNVVMNNELTLLEKNILMAGWIQPILISRDGIIIDGFHRFMLSRESPRLRERYHGMVPCAVIDASQAEAKIMTVNLNRAKGTHVALRMADIVQDLVNNHHLDKQEVAQKIGAPIEEVEVLYQNSIFKAKNLKDYRYSRAWVPVEKNDIQAKKGKIC